MEACLASIFSSIMRSYCKSHENFAQLFVIFSASPFSRMKNLLNDLFIYFNEYLIKGPVMHFLYSTLRDALLEKNFATIRIYLADKTCPLPWRLFIKNLYLMPMAIFALLWQLFERELHDLAFLGECINYS